MMMPRPQGMAAPAPSPWAPAPDDQFDAQALEAPEEANVEADPDLIRLTQGAVDDLLEEIRLAREDERELADKRQGLMDAFLRRPFGNEIEGRAHYVAADVKRQCTQTFSPILKQALSTSQKTQYLGPDQEIADALRVLNLQTLQKLGAKRIYSSLIFDGLVNIFGAAKVWWEEKWTKIVREHVVDEAGLMRLREGVQAGLVESIRVEALPQEEAIIQAPGQAAISVLSPATYQVEATMLALENAGPRVAPVPPEQLLIQRGKTEMNDQLGIGLEREVTVAEVLRMQERYSTPQKPFFHNLQAALEAGEGGEDSAAKSERENREAIHYSASSPWDTSASAEQLKKKLRLVEWVGYVISDGAERWAKTWILGRQCIRCSVNDQEIVPYVGWSPSTLSHSLRGLAVAEDHLHEMKMRSTLARGLMDQIGFALDREMYAAEAGTDYLGLERRYPGRIIPGKKTDFEYADPPIIDARIYMGMEWISNEANATGPSNPLVFGGRPDPREKTATGTRIRTNTAMWQLDTVALNFTEDCLVDLHQKMIKLWQQNMKGEVPVMVNGKRVVLTQEAIQGPYTCVADFQLELDYDDSRFTKAKVLADDAIATSQKYPMLYPLGKIAAAKRAMYVAAGERDPNKFLEPPPPNMEGWYQGSGAGRRQVRAAATVAPPGSQRARLAQLMAARGGAGPRPGMAPVDQVADDGSAQPQMTRQELA